MEKKRPPLLYRLIEDTVRFFAPEFQIAGRENVPEEPCVFVGNHAQIYGPISSVLYTPHPKHAVWCIGEMMDRKEVPEYAYRDFWSEKPRSVRWFFWLASRVIGPLAEYVLTNAGTIPVYHDTRLIRTYRESIKKLRDGSSIIIFPEQNLPHNGILCEFQDKFVDLARFYYRQTGKVLSFVPVYTAPRLKTLFYGRPVRFDPEAPIAEERRRVCNALMDAVTDLAEAQPEHIVVPYRNIPKKDYPKNKA